MHTVLVETLPHLVSVDAARVGGQQGGYVISGRLVLVLSRAQDRRGPPKVSNTVLEGLYCEFDDARRCHRCDGGYRGLVVQQQHCFETDIADFRTLA